MPKELKNVSAVAEPSKEFFISMLTRDIRLTDCILDLIDNSVDSIVYNTSFDPMQDLLKKSTKKNSLKNYHIEIDFNNTQFSIRDNAYGISKDDAQARVFRFGAEAIKRGKRGGLSIYGIGMKRACYKIGNFIDIESATNKTYLRVSYDVSTWLKSNEWKLDIGWRPKEKRDARGTLITIKKLHSEIVESLGLETFRAELLSKIGSAYSLFLKNGLRVTVNGVQAESRIPTLPESPNLQSGRKTFEKDKVKTLIIAGISRNEEKRAGGWYIFCNGRMILEADKTSNTGWGDGIRKFHQAIYPFLGFVYFQSDALDKLPWTTTKDNINFESSIYQYTLARMKAVAAPIVQVLVKKYNQKGFAKDYDKVVNSSKNLELTNLNKKDRAFVFNAQKSEKEEEISFVAKLKDIDRAKKAIGKNNITNEEIGKYSFKYFLDHEAA